MTNIADLRPLLHVERNGPDHHLVVGVTEFDPATGLANRDYVLVSQSEHMADTVVMSRFYKLARLMGDNVRTEVRL